MLDPTPACEPLVGLPEVNVPEVIEPLAARIMIAVESPIAEALGALIDLTYFGWPVTWRWCCPRRWCRVVDP